MNARLIISYILSIIMLPFIIVGTILMIVGRFLIALGRLLWFEPKVARKELNDLYCDIKYWIGM